MRIDHLVVAVRDLDKAARRYREELGLDSAPGGRHPGWGTGNRILPLSTYVELIAVIDAEEAAGLAAPWACTVGARCSRDRHRVGRGRGRRRSSA